MKGHSPSEDPFDCHNPPWRGGTVIQKTMRVYIASWWVSDRAPMRRFIVVDEDRKKALAQVRDHIQADDKDAFMKTVVLSNIPRRGPKLMWMEGLDLVDAHNPEDKGE